MAAQLKNRRHKIFLPSDLARHNKPNDCWVTHAGRVYDVTQFLQDHPGGDDLILRYAGKDVAAVMNDPDEHAHSDSAFDMLSEFQIGLIGTEETIVRDDVVIDDDWHPDETQVAEDFRKNQFLDLEKPLIMQVWRANFSKAFYLQQVHQPRHIPHPARLFGPWYLEMFTRTSWYVVPMVWLPVAAAIFRRSLVQQADINQATGEMNIGAAAWRTTMTCFLIGNVIWTFLEYLLHRFLFHVDDMLPDNGACLTLHFLLHGIHHYIPMDKLRLVMPPLLFFVLSYPFTQLAHSLFVPHIANGLIAGAFAFYVLYDVCHYSLHHVALPPYLKEMKKYHMAHHFKNFELGFGVTSKFWDYVFGTLLRL